MKRAFLLGAIVLATAFPFAAAARQIQTLDLENGKVNATWRGFEGAQATPQTEGLLITTASSLGTVIADVSFTDLPRAGILTTSSEQNVEGYFIWSVDRGGSLQGYAVPITIGAGKNVQTILFLSRYDFWEQPVKQLGLRLKPGSKLLLTSVVLEEPNWLDSTVDAVKAFWTFDVYSPYSINFLWGPQLASSTIQRLHMMESGETPFATSATLAAFVLLLLVFAAIAIIRFVRAPQLFSRRRILVPIFCISLFTWLVFDARMGLEFLSWVHADYAQYIGAPAGERTFRERGSFYDFAAFAAPLVADRKSYVFFADHQWPYLGNIRYVTYPSLPGDGIGKDDTWVVYNRPDIGVNDQKQITVDGKPVTQAGEVLGRFDANSFVFRLPAGHLATLPQTHP